MTGGDFEPAIELLCWVAMNPDLPKRSRLAAAKQVVTRLEEMPEHLAHPTGPNLAEKLIADPGTADAGARRVAGETFRRIRCPDQAASRST